MDEKERQVITRVTLAIVIWMIAITFVLFIGLYGELCLLAWGMATIGTIFYIINQARNG